MSVPKHFRLPDTRSNSSFCVLQEVYEQRLKRLKQKLNTIKYWSIYELDVSVTENIRLPDTRSNSTFISYCRKYEQRQKPYKLAMSVLDHVCTGSYPVTGYNEQLYFYFVLQEVRAEAEAPEAEPGLVGQPEVRARH